MDLPRSGTTGGCRTSDCNKGDSGNHTTGLFKSSSHSEPLSHLSSPLTFVFQSVSVEKLVDRSYSLPSFRKIGMVESFICTK